MTLLKPKLRFNEFSEGWIKKPIENAIDFISGFAFKADEISEDSNGVPLMRGINITEGSIRHNKEIDRYFVGDTKKLEKYKLKKGDIVIGMDGSKVGKNSAIVSDINSDSLLVQRVARLREKENSSLNFIYHHINSNRFHAYVDEVKTSSGIPHISASDIKNFNIFIPTLPEQTKIANFLTAVDEKIQALKEKKRLLEEYKKGLMQKIFSQEIRFKQEDGSDFPDWEEKSLYEIGFFQTSSIDKLIKENEKEVFLVNYMNVYRHENINNVTVKNFQKVTAKENQIESCNLKKGDILFTPSSETPDDIGHSVVIFEDLENSVFSYHLMRFRPFVEIDILYSHYFCNIPSVLAQLSKLATGSTRFTISVKSFSSVQIMLPSIIEQRKIAKILKAIDQKKEKVGHQIEEAQTYKKGLLQQMFV